MVSLIDEIHRVMTIHWVQWLKATLPGQDEDLRYSDCFDPFDFPPLSETPDPQSTMLELSAKFSLLPYIAQKVREDPSILVASGRPLLEYAVRPAFQFFPNDYLIKPASIRPFLETMIFLLHKGSDPNEAWNGRSPWESLLLMPKSTNFLRRLVGLLLTT